MVQNALRKEVNRLNEENDKLAKEVTLLEQQVLRINEKESELEQITQQQNINCNEFMQLCTTNRTTLDELKVPQLGYSICLGLLQYICMYCLTTPTHFIVFTDCHSG
jgi:hypothetical protein